MEKIIDRYPENFVEKLGPEDWIKVPPIKLEIDKRKAEKMCPPTTLNLMMFPTIYVYHSKERFVIC